MRGVARRRFGREWWVAVEVKWGSVRILWGRSEVGGGVGLAEWGRCGVWWVRKGLKGRGGMVAFDLERCVLCGVSGCDADVRWGWGGVQGSYVFSGLGGVISWLPSC